MPVGLLVPFALLLLYSELFDFIMEYESIHSKHNHNFHDQYILFSAGK